MFTVYTRSPQKKITTITQYLYGTKKYRWLNDVCQWYQYKQDTQWSKYPLQQGIIQQSVVGSCITSYLSRAKLDQIQYLQGNQAIAKQLYDKDIQGTYQTQEQRKDCQCGSLYRVYVKRTAQWNSDRCKWKQPSYQIYYTVDEQVSDQASYERDQLGCITKIQQSLYMGRTVSSYRLQEFGGLQNLTVFPQETMQQIQFMSWGPVQQQENCLCSPVVYNFYRYRKASLKDTAWTTDSLTYQCSTDDLLVFIKGYKQQDQPCYTRSQERQFIQSVKRKLSQQDIQDIKQQLEQQDIQNPPTWSALKQPPTCSSVYRIDRHYLFDCQKVEWIETYTDDYGLTNVMPDFSLSDSNYVRTYYQNDNQGNLDYQTAYMQYVGQQAVLHVRIAKAFKNNQATANDATTKRYFNPKVLNCSNLDYAPGTNIIQDATLHLSIISQQNKSAAKQCISLFSYNNSYYLQYYNNKTDKYLFTILIGKIKGVPICINYRYLSADFNIYYVALSSSNHVKLLTSQAIYYIDLSTGLVQKYSQLGQIFTSVKCTTSSCYFIATTINNSTPSLYYWGILPDPLTVQPKTRNYSQADQTIYRMGDALNIDSLYLFNQFLVGFNTEGALGDYILCMPPWLFANQAGIYLFYNSLYKKVHKPQLQPVINYINEQRARTTISFQVPYYATDPYGNITLLSFNPPITIHTIKIDEQSTQLNLQAFSILYPVTHKSSLVSWVSVASPDLSNISDIEVHWFRRTGDSVISSAVQLINYRKNLLATNIDALFCKQQAFDDTILLRPTHIPYNPAKVVPTTHHDSNGTIYGIIMLARDSIDMTQNYRYVLDFSYAWNTTYSFWQMQNMTFQATGQSVTQSLGYNQEQTQYTGKLLVTPDVQVSHVYYNVLLPGKPYAQSFSPPQPVYAQLSNVYKPISRVVNTTRTTDASFCSAAYGAWFTGRTMTQGDTCYCLVYTDQTRTQIQKLQGQCTDTQISYSFAYLSDSDIKVVTPSALAYISPWTKVDSYASMRKDSNVVPIISMYGDSCFVQQATFTQSEVTYGYIITVAYGQNGAPADSISVSFIQYKQQNSYTVFNAYISPDRTYLRLITATVYGTQASTGRPYSYGFTNIYAGTNPQNTPWYALARVHAASYLVLLSPTHIGYLNNNDISTIRLNTQYSDKITSIYTRWSFLTQATAIFAALTKNKQGVAFIFFSPLTATYKTITANVSIPTNQDVSIVGVSCYDTKQIGVVIGPYTVCTVDSNYGPRQRVTLVKLKNTGATVDTVYVSYNKEIKVSVLSDVPDTELHAFSSGSSVTFSDPQKDLIKSYDKDLVVFNLNSQWPKYILNIKTCTITKASVV